MLSMLCMGLVYLAFNESARLNQIKKKGNKDIIEKENEFTKK